MATSKDTLLAQIPGHIVENYPGFFDFLEAYYEWLSKEGNAHERIDQHMDYLNFEKSLDEYVNMMKQEYLSDIPDSVLFDKELFIKWSKQFNLMRGSHASYKFLFRLLFNEQNTDIYIPKENILRTSDGNWISGENVMLVTHDASNATQFQFEQIYQVRPIYKDIVETATAVVQRVRTIFAGKYQVTELSLVDVEGEFKSGFPIETENGVKEWMINSFTDIDIDTRGTGYRTGQRVLIDNLDYNSIRHDAEQDVEFDTRVTSFFKTADVIELRVNGAAVTDYEFDGRIISSSSIKEGDDIVVLLPPHQGYMAVDTVDENLGVTNIKIIDAPIGCPVCEDYGLTVDGIGSGLSGKPVPGFIRPLDGYYESTKGQLSSNMYLQDSFYYQNYSYVIKTQQDLSAYADIVKKVLHPAGFKLFGQISVTTIIEILLSYVSETIFVFSPSTMPVVTKYGLGANYSFVDKLGPGTSIRLYKPDYFDSLDQLYRKGEAGYNLESKYLADRADTYQYNPLKGWMSKLNLSDYYLYIPQNYSEENDSGDTYFETGYTSDTL